MPNSETKATIPQLEPQWNYRGTQKLLKRSHIYHSKTENRPRESTPKAQLPTKKQKTADLSFLKCPSLHPKNPSILDGQMMKEVTINIPLTLTTDGNPWCTTPHPDDPWPCQSTPSLSLSDDALGDGSTNKKDIFIFTIQTKSHGLFSLFRTQKSQVTKDDPRWFWFFFKRKKTKKKRTL